MPSHHLHVLTLGFLFFLTSLVFCSKIRTPAATYLGSTLTLEHFDSFRPSTTVDQYLGIRYGLSPTGSRRFKRPLPAWIEVSGPKSAEANQFQATTWPVACMQQPGFLEMNLHTNERSEDCLMLNIWVPNGTAAELKPVFVWFHGGSFISDSSSRKLYQGAHLAATTDAIVITVNFRIDAFGFLYSGPEQLNGTESAEGNLALWDQQLALEWIAEHIEHFGGDPKRVTIAGANSGATSIGLHVLNERSRRYFSRAIMLSGSIFTQLVSGTKEVGSKIANMWVQAAKKINCGDGHHWTIGTLKCLQKASSDELLKLLDPLAAVSLSPEVVLGDQFLPFPNLVSAIEEVAKSSTKEIQILLGSTDDEGSLVLPLMSSETFALFQPKELSQGQAFEELKKLASLLVPPRGVPVSSVDGDEVARFYINSQMAGSSSGSFLRTIGQALGDFYVSCPLIEFGRRISGGSRIKVFQYVWTRKVNSVDVPCADWMGACHGSDLVMLFGGPFEERDKFRPEDRRASVQFMKTIRQFLWKGQPLKQEGKEWPTYYANGSADTFYYEFTESRASKTRIYRKNWKQEVCADLWRKYLIA